jgi:hypothetical protein
MNILTKKQIDDHNKMVNRISTMVMVFMLIASIVGVLAMILLFSYGVHLIWG